MDRLKSMNPFVKRESYSGSSVITYKVLTLISWLLVLLPTVYYAYNAPTEGGLPRRSISRQSEKHFTPFTLNLVFVSLYWVVLWVLQLCYVWHLFSSNADFVTAASNVGSHFIFFNLLQFGFVMLWVRSYFYWGELLLLINFFNLTFLYFNHRTSPILIHIPVVVMPLAWTFVGIFWNGAVAVHMHTLAARILANIALWGFLGFGGFFLVAYKDYTMGFTMSYLTAALGVAQFLDKKIALQWIFAFTIMAMLFILSLAIAVPGIFFGVKFGIEPGEPSGASDDRERQPLLEGN